MNTDAGTEEFFWREMTQEEERQAKAALMKKNKERLDGFLDEIRRKEQRREAKRKNR